MQCNKCRREATLFQEYSGLHLCKQHVEDAVETTAKYEIRRNRWMIPGDHIAVALSGRKNSSALLYFLKKLTSNRRDIRISAITIDEGITGYSDPECAMRIAREMGVECIPVSFLENFGSTSEEFEYKKGIKFSCTHCRGIKNFLLNRIAGEHGVTKLALGDTLDDSAVSVLKNILQGTPEWLVGCERTGRGKILTIHPFISVPQKEVALYADLHLKGCNPSCCPFKNDPFLGDIKTILNDYTIRHPSTKYALMNLKKNLTGECETLAELIPHCAQCGEPSEGDCQSCRITGKVIDRGA